MADGTLKCYLVKVRLKSIGRLPMKRITDVSSCVLIDCTVCMTLKQPEYKLYQKCITSFKYLGSVITDQGSKPEILSRTAQTTAALTRLKPVWIDKSISLSSKMRLKHSLVTSIFLYACESWTLTAELQRRMQAMK